MERQKERIPVISSDVSLGVRARLQEQLLGPVLREWGDDGVMNWLREKGAGVEALLGSGRLDGETEEDYKTRGDLVRRILSEDEHSHRLSDNTLEEVRVYVGSHTHTDVSIH